MIDFMQQAIDEIPARVRDHRDKCEAKPVAGPHDEDARCPVCFAVVPAGTGVRRYIPSFESVYGGKPVPAQPLCADREACIRREIATRHSYWTTAKVYRRSVPW